MESNNNDSRSPPQETKFIHLKSSKPTCRHMINYTRMDGGYSWVVTFAAFVVQFTVIGYVNNVSSINPYWIEEFNLSEGSVPWIGSINAGTMFVFAPIVSMLANKVGCQFVGIIGCICCTFGILGASFAYNFVTLLLSYGLLFGTGVSCCFFSSILIQTKYFNKRLALSNGIVTAGSGAGTFIISSIAYRFYEKVGWRVGLRYVSLILLVLIIFQMFYNDIVINIGLCFNTSEKNTKKNTTKLSAWIWLSSTATDICNILLLKQIPFLIFTIACIFFMLGYFVPYIHLVFFAEKAGISHEVASMFIGYMAISSLTGKLITGKVAEIKSVSSTFLLIIAFSMIGVAHIFGTLSTQYYHFLIYSIVFGFFDGAYSCLIAVIVGDLIGIKNLSSGIGLLFGLKSIPFMLGGPLAGLLYERTQSYMVPFLVSGIFTFCATYLLLIIPFYQLFYNRQTKYKKIPTDYEPITDEENLVESVSNENEENHNISKV